MFSTKIIEEDTWHLIEGETFTGAIWDDLHRLCESGEALSYLSGELGADDVLSDGTFHYCGSDVQDFLGDRK